MVLITGQNLINRDVKYYNMFLTYCINTKENTQYIPSELTIINSAQSTYIRANALITLINKFFNNYCPIFPGINLSKFIFNDNEMEINTKKILVLTDFEESLIISKENRKVMLQFNKCKYIDTLESNIYNTFSMAIELLKSDKEKYELSRILNKNTNDKNESTELFVAFCNKTIKIKEYKKRINKIVIDIIILLFKEMFNKNF
jgi:hypothetical protein